MKNQNSGKRNVLQTLLAATVSIFILSGFSINAGAQTRVSLTETQAQTPVEIKYIGQLNYQPIYHVTVSNDQDEELYLTIKDSDQYVLYTTRIKEKFFSKKFQINTAEVNSNVFTVSVSTKNDKKAQVYQISNVTTFVDDVVVTKVF